MDLTAGVPSSFINNLFVHNGPIDLGYECYTMRSLIGAGGLGVVVKAARRTGELVALKFLYSPMGRSGGESFERFKQEVKMTKLVGDVSDACVRVHECGEYASPALGAVPFFCMEYVPGLSLEDFLLLKESPFTPQEIYVVARHIASALADIHDRGIVHRDMKPSNILFHESRRVLKVTDFGISRDSAAPADVTMAGEDGRPVILGTINYLSRYYFDTTSVPPEDMAENNDGRWIRRSTGEFVNRDSEGNGFCGYKGRCLDLSVLASVLLFELTTGVNPYAGITFPAILTELMSASRLDLRSFFASHPERLHPLIRKKTGFLSHLDRIIRRGSTAKRSQSYHSADQIMADLDRALKSCWGSVPSPAQSDQIMASLLGKALVDEYEQVLLRVEQTVRDHTFGDDRKDTTRLAILYKIKRSDRLMACVDLLLARTRRLTEAPQTAPRECSVILDTWNKLERYGLSRECRAAATTLRAAAALRERAL